MTASDIDYIREALRTVVDSQARHLQALSELRSDVASYAATQAEHARRLCELELARSTDRDRVALAAADTGRYGITAEMRVAGLERLHSERIAAVEKATAEKAPAARVEEAERATAKLAADLRYWTRWALGQAFLLGIGAIAWLLVRFVFKLP